MPTPRVEEGAKGGRDREREGGRETDRQVQAPHICKYMHVHGTQRGADRAGTERGTEIGRRTTPAAFQIHGMRS